LKVVIEELSDDKQDIPLSLHTLEWTKLLVTLLEITLGDLAYGPDLPSAVSIPLTSSGGFRVI
jgi:hypothetical protein